MPTWLEVHEPGMRVVTADEDDDLRRWRVQADGSLVEEDTDE